MHAPFGQNSRFLPESPVIVRNPRQSAIVGRSSTRRRIPLGNADSALWDTARNTPLHTREVAGSKPAAPILKVPAIRVVLGRWCRQEPVQHPAEIGFLPVSAGVRAGRRCPRSRVRRGRRRRGRRESRGGRAPQALYDDRSAPERAGEKPAEKPPRLQDPQGVQNSAPLLSNGARMEAPWCFSMPPRGIRRIRRPRPRRLV
jgi:hypothetical protein